MEELLRKEIEAVVKKNKDGYDVDIAVDIITDRVLDWPSWYYELSAGGYGLYRPALKYSSISEALKAYGSGGSVLVRTVDKYVTESVSALRVISERNSFYAGLDLEDTDSIVQSILETVLFFHGWYDDYISDAYWSTDSDDLAVYDEAYSGDYGDADFNGSGIRR